MSLPLVTVPNIRRMREMVNMPAVELIARLRQEGIKVAPADLSRIERALEFPPEGLLMVAARILFNEGRDRGLVW